MTKNYKIIVVSLITISVIGLFLPWFFFDMSVDYTNGLHWVTSSPLWIGILGSVVLIFFKKRTDTINVINLITLLLIPISCFYLFFTWHILTITGGFDINVSLHTAHYGFYMTAISSAIAVIVYYIGMIKGRAKY